MSCLLAWVLVACQSGLPQDAKIVTVFVDASASVKDVDVYREAWSKITERLRGGDRILLGRISDETYTRFRPIVDRELPVFTLNDNRLVFDKRLRAIRQEIAGVIEKAIATPRAPKTDVLNTLFLAQKIFEGDKRRRVLVILSDMIEDSEAYNFERLRVTPEFTKKVIEERRVQGRLADLGGATVYVAGASARTAAKALELQAFWLEYVKAANGRLAYANYAPALINFNE